MLYCCGGVFLSIWLNTPKPLLPFHIHTINNQILEIRPSQLNLQNILENAYINPIWYSLNVKPLQFKIIVYMRRYDKIIVDESFARFTA